MPGYDQIDNHACMLKSSLGETSTRTVTSRERLANEKITYNEMIKNTMTLSQS